MKTLLLVILSLGVGLASGWYFGYTRPLAYYGRNMQKITGMTDEQIFAALKDTKAMLKSLGTQQKAVAIISLAALNGIENGHIDTTKSFLAQQVADYYHIFHRFEDTSPDNDKLLERIEESAITSPSLKQSLAKKPE